MSGPIFISGMPRSGTKLLRDLVNNHSRISIPESETHFIPSFIREFGLDYSFTNDKNIKLLIKHFHNTKFYLGHTHIKMTENDFNGASYPSSWSDFFERILRFYGVKESADVIFGDKTPGYVLHLPLLLKIWPDMKMIHIVRDPRDYASSVRKAWGMSIRRAAYRWESTLQKVNDFNALYQSSYMELRYEDLLEDADTELSKICEFIGCEFEEDMSKLTKVTENLGAVKNHIGLVRENKHQYTKNLSPTEISVIERICHAEGSSRGYYSSRDIMPLKLSSFTLASLRYYDGIKAILFHIKEKGIVGGSKYFIKLHKDGAFKGEVS